MHTNFSTQAYKKWLKEADMDDFAAALRRLAQLNQTEVYLFWKNPDLEYGGGTCLN